MNCWKFLILAFGIIPASIFAQNRSLQSVTLTSVTLTIDSVDTQAEMQMVMGTVKAYEEVQDFDIKFAKCNFTLDNSNQILTSILQALENDGFAAKIYRVEENQTFTYVPVRECATEKRNLPDMSEQEVIDKGITRGTPPPPPVERK
ncbi:MAG: hypothetical protein AAF570_07760, partial [Bacteroidota bacterium]